MRAIVAVPLFVSALFAADVAAAAPSAGVAFFAGSRSKATSVFVDGKKIGDVPRLKYGDPVQRVDATVAPGEHRIGYRLDGAAKAEETTLVLRDGETAVLWINGKSPTLAARLEGVGEPAGDAQGTLTLVSHTGSLAVAVDDKTGAIKVPAAVGGTPARVSKKLPAGIVLLRSHFSGTPSGRQTAVRVRPGQETVLRLDPLHVELLDADAAKLARVEVTGWSKTTVLVVDGVDTGLLPEPTDDTTYPHAVFQVRPGKVSVAVKGMLRKLGEGTLALAAGERVVAHVDGGELKIDGRELPKVAVPPKKLVPIRAIRRPVPPKKLKPLRRR